MFLIKISMRNWQAFSFANVDKFNDSVDSAQKRSKLPNPIINLYSPKCHL